MNRFFNTLAMAERLPARDSVRGQAKWFASFPPQTRLLLEFFFFEAIYCLAYLYGMSFSQDFASPFWFPDSVLLCALLVNPPRRWWLFILGPLPIRILLAAPEIPIWFLLATFAIDSVKGLLAATALRRVLRNPLRLDSVREFAMYSLWAVTLIPALGAFAGATARHRLGHDFWDAWEQWFIGNVLTHLVVTPAILYWLFNARAFRWPSPGRRSEAVLLTAGLILSGYLAFATGFLRIGFDETRYYVPIPFLFWAAVRFGMLGASGAIAITASLAVHAALAGRGPFADLPSGTAPRAPGASNSNLSPSNNSSIK